MAQKEEEEEKKEGQTKEADVEDGEPPEEVAKEEDKQRDPDEAKLAEESIVAYVHDVMDQVTPVFESALETFGNFLTSQANPEIFNDAGFLEKAASGFMQELTAMFGEGTPILQAILPDMGSAIDQIMRNPRAENFAQELSSKVHDACSFIRSNVQSILSNQWDQLLDLAYEGSDQFIPLLHELGLPMPNKLDAGKISAPLQTHAEQYAQEAQAKEEEGAQKKEGEEVSDQKKELAEEEKKNVQMEEEGAEKAVA